MECRVCGGLVEWRSVACDQTQCRRCGATDSQVEEEEQDDNAAPTAETLMGEAISAGLGRSAEDLETMPAVEPDACPTEADSRQSPAADALQDQARYVGEYLRLGTFDRPVLWYWIRKVTSTQGADDAGPTQADLRGEVDHG